MGAANQQIELADLRHYWRRWTRVVAQCATRRASRPRISPADYHTLQTMLLNACQSYADRADESKQPFFEQMAGLVQPWVTLESLMHAHRPILNELLQQTSVVEQQLCGRTMTIRWQKPVRYVAIAAVVAALIAALFLTLEHEMLPRLTFHARSLYYSLSSNIASTSFLTKFSVITVVVVLIGVWMLSNPRRY